MSLYDTGLHTAVVMCARRRERSHLAETPENPGSPYQRLFMNFPSTVPARPSSTCVTIGERRFYAGDRSVAAVERNS